MKFNLVYITTRDKKEAKKIGRALLKNRLAACINIIGKIESMYWWEGKIEEGQETILIAKTQQSLVSELIHKVKALHSYDNPCIVAWPISAGTRKYLDWLKKETK